MPRVGKGTRPKTPGSGRVAGVPNKATATAREAIAMVADGMAEDFMGWLTATAQGVSEPQTEAQIAAKEQPKYIVKPNPEGAAKVYLAAIEYHIPKLARTEHVGKDGEKLFDKVEFVFDGGPK